MGVELLEIGRIDKPHGVRGEVIVRLVTNRVERLAPGSRLATDREELVVRSSRPHQHRWIVEFDGVADRNAADALHGVALYAEPLEDPEELWVHELVGKAVAETDGTSRGVVVEVQENPAADLLVLDSGALVPLNFVVSIDDDLIEVEVPPGLFELVES
ncbi:MAG: 16S rRNA processing protein RimM [Acidimicrobiales bacterium]|nr:16S rRNA processing protein RimM [Acidimicrobiales bacterium]